MKHRHERSYLMTAAMCIAVALFAGFLIHTSTAVQAAGVPLHSRRDFLKS